MSISQQKLPPDPDKPGADAINLSAIFGPGPHTREQLAQFMNLYGARIRRRVRGKVRALRAAGGYVPLAWLDEDDILSTVTRRVDAATHVGRLRTDSAAELCAYINTITDNAFNDRLHDGIREHRSQAAILEAKPASPHTAPPKLATDESARRLIEAAPSDDDRDLLTFKARGAAYAAIAEATGRSQQALRTQWSQLRRLLLGKSPPPPPAFLGHAA